MDFVVGQPRSGTFFTSHVLNAAGGVTAIHEHLLSLTGFQLLGAAKDYYEGTATADEIKPYLRAYALRPEARIDCNYALTWILPPLLEMYPGAKFVHLTRDPRDNIRSCFNVLDCYGAFWHQHRSRQPFAQWCVTQRNPLFCLQMREFDLARPCIKRPDWDALTQFERICAYWTEGHRLILDALARREGYLLMRVEDYRSSFDSVIRLFDFLGIPAPAEDKLRKRIVVGVNTSEDQLWATVQRIKIEQQAQLLPKRFDEWPATYQETLRRMCGEMAARLGYSL